MDNPSATPRRVSTPSWLDLRLVLGAVLVLGAIVLGAVVVSQARHTVEVEALTRDLSSGSVVRAADLRAVAVQLPNDGRGVYLARAAEAIGQVLNRDLRSGELLPAAALGPRPPSTTVSIAVPAGAAPDLSVGQRIEVWLSTVGCPSVVLLSDVTVQQAKAASSGAFAGGGGQDVVLSLPPALAQRVVGALALPDASIRAGVLDGPAAGGSGGLPDLAGCGGATGAPSR
jgi:SAF domain